MYVECMYKKVFRSPGARHDVGCADFLLLEVHGGALDLEAVDAASEAPAEPATRDLWNVLHHPSQENVAGRVQDLEETLEKEGKKEKTRLTSTKEAR